MPTAIQIAGLGLILATLAFAQRLGGWKHELLARCLGIFAAALLIAWSFLFLPSWSRWPVATITWSICVWLVSRWLQPGINGRARTPYIKPNWTPLFPPPDPSKVEERRRFLQFIADADVHQMEGRIFYSIHDMSTDPRLDLSEPYIDLSFLLGNLSIFELKLERLDGKITYGPHPGAPFERKPEVPDNGFVLRHAEVKNLVLRQWMSVETARQIKEALRETRGVKTLGTGEFALVFSYTTHIGNRGEVRRTFPDRMFHVDPAQ